MVRSGPGFELCRVTLPARSGANIARAAFRSGLSRGAAGAIATSSPDGQAKYAIAPIKQMIPSPMPMSRPIQRETTASGPTTFAATGTGARLPNAGCLESLCLPLRFLLRLAIRLRRAGATQARDAPNRHSV